MNALNRVLAVLLLRLVLAAALVTLGMVTGLLTMAAVRHGWPSAPVVAITPDLGRHGRGVAWLVGEAIVGGPLALLLLPRELTPRRTRRVRPATGAPTSRPREAKGGRWG